MFDIAAICLTLTAVLAYFNHRFVRLPMAIGVMVIALLLSLGIIALARLGIAAELLRHEELFVRSIDFSDVLMRGMLSLLLFAGALHVDLSALKSYRWQIGALALVGTSASTLVVGFGMWFALPWIGIGLPLVYCLLFGALISPTDPIAVIGIMRTAGAPRNLELVIAGESLFNDGVGVVLFALLLSVALQGSWPGTGAAATLLLQEAGGGIVFGLVLGWITNRMLKSIDEYQVEVLLTLAAVMGGYALANHLHVSGPLAMVVCGLMVGNAGRSHAMSDVTRKYVDMFWELIDSILNAVLFVLIGLEVLLVEFSVSLLVAGLLAVVVTLIARALTVGLPVRVLCSHFRLPPGSSSVLTWGGLRGGISVALALSLTNSDSAPAARETILALTYCVVVFSVLVQGLTIGRVVRHRVLDRS
ncbi:MAG: sodium:proton antiporter [Burkholderiaceae bacterium]